MWPLRNGGHILSLGTEDASSEARGTDPRGLFPGTKKRPPRPKSRRAFYFREKMPKTAIPAPDVSSPPTSLRLRALSATGDQREWSDD